MKTLSDSALTLVSRLSEHLGPVTTLIDSTMDRLAGQQVARACPGALCDQECYAITGEYVWGQLISIWWQEVDNYAYQPFLCDSYNYSCQDWLYYWSLNCPQ